VAEQLAQGDGFFGGGTVRELGFGKFWHPASGGFVEGEFALVHEDHEGGGVDGFRHGGDPEDVIFAHGTLLFDVGHADGFVVDDAAFFNDEGDDSSGLIFLEGEFHGGPDFGEFLGIDRLGAEREQRADREEGEEGEAEEHDDRGRFSFCGWVGGGLASFLDPDIAVDDASTERFEPDGTVGFFGSFESVWGGACDGLFIHGLVSVEADGEDGVGLFFSGLIEARSGEVDVEGLPYERRQAGVGDFAWVGEHAAADAGCALEAGSGEHGEFGCFQFFAEEGGCGGAAASGEIEVEAEAVTDGDFVAGHEVDACVGAAPRDVFWFPAGHEFDVEGEVFESLFCDGAGHEVVLEQGGFGQSFDVFAFFEGFGSVLSWAEEDDGALGWLHAEGWAGSFDAFEGGGVGSGFEGDAAGGESGGWAVFFDGIEGDGGALGGSAFEERVARSVPSIAWEATGEHEGVEGAVTARDDLHTDAGRAISADVLALEEEFLADGLGVEETFCGFEGCGIEGFCGGGVMRGEGGEEGGECEGEEEGV
jgi:hypothetical protein